ncbi:MULTISPECIES: DUF928 domain-containing protein [unclassified Coleofasciculus]|uniref:DUF928 domain-containing protein n=1 Tax=unclassified Coleofasciculus TaxID=2692782 RepID=UPI00187FAA2A|nr:MULTISPECIES: DUF928 domain-containing protein [unclassified Coleofasciculus]MBE9128240.1 DUF928 domain-containing protein [Coleofasciculus sp. LEGE 07081]MBE9147766.1 DUF928 domain-containing protein [Coleofasciculus sp. LEGE 07092]
MRFHFRKFSLALSIQLVLLAGGLAFLQTPRVLLAQGIPQTWEAKEYKPPAGIGAPTRTEPGGTRSPVDSCPVNGKALKALVPSNNFGTTVAAYPTFFVYMPASSSGTTLPVEFVLEDIEDNPIYKTTFDSSGKSGIITLSLPTEVGLAPLKVGQDYKWSFSVMCQSNERSKDLVVEGWVRRVELDPRLATQLAQASPEQQVDLYSDAEIWHDALAKLVEQRRNNPGDSKVANQWVKLLNAANLSDLIQESLVSDLTTPEELLSSSY